MYEDVRVPCARALCARAPVRACIPPSIWAGAGVRVRDVVCACKKDMEKRRELQ